jgi:hypothetical protein
MQSDTLSLAEGETTQAPTRADIQYTGVTSCLTLTLIYSEGTASGGHAALVPAEGQKTIDEIVAELKAQARGKTVTKLVVSGEIEIWDQNIRHASSQYASVKDIEEALITPGTQVIEQDTGEDFQGRGAYIIVASDHQELIINDVQGKQVRKVAL